MNKIYLSPSNQGDNVGVGNYGTEKDRMNEVCNIVQKELIKNNNFEVIRGSIDSKLSDRINNANTNNVDIYVALHSNAGGGKGCEVYKYSTSENGLKLAQIIYNKIVAISPNSGRGIKIGDEFMEINSTNAPAILVEIAFHDNLEDANWIINNIEKIGIEIAKGIYEYFGIDYGKVEDESIPEPQIPTTEVLPINVNDKVRILNNVSYDGVTLDDWVLDENEIFDVIEVYGNRIVVGKGTAVTTAIDINNIKKV